MYICICVYVVCPYTHTCVDPFYSVTTGSPKWIHLTKTESQSIYTALQSSDISEIARALNEQQVTMVTAI